MRYKVLGFLFLFILTPQVHTAQEEGFDRRFDSIYFDAATNIAGRNIQLAFQIADSLYQQSASDLHKVRSLMLSSKLYQQIGENKKSVEYALMAEKIAESTNLYDWQARISGFLSTQYRKIGLYSRGRVYLEKGIATSRKISDETIKTLYLAMVYQESAYYELHEQALLNAQKNINIADTYFNKLPDGINKDYFLATNRKLSGRVFIKLEKYEEAYLDYQTALALLENVTQSDALLNGFIYSGLGRVYLHREEYTNSIKYLDLAESIAENSDFTNLKLEVYKTLSDYYAALNTISESQKYSDKYYEIFRRNEANKRKYISSFVDTIEKEKMVLLGNRNLLFLIFVLITFSFVLITILYRRKKKKEFNRFKAVIATLKQQDKHRALEEGAHHKIKKLDKKNIMSAEVEERILCELKKFEEGKKFTDKDISISVLAGEFKTNTKYLSHVLNLHKNKDFNNYINSLRIEYIIRKLETDKEYTKYKISYLAEQCGFSSHSKFTNVFKSYTGLTPSIFMEYIEKDLKETQQLQKSI